MNFKAKEIAEFLNGEVVGNGEVKVSNVSKIEEGKPGTLAFLAKAKYESYIYNTEASIVLVNRTFVPKKEINSTLIKVDDAYEAFANLLNLYVEARAIAKVGIEQPSFIDKSTTYGENIYVGAFAYVGKNSKIGKNVKIYPQVYIGENVTIGDNCTFYAGAKIYDDSVIGNNCTIHASAVIGADGFGFAPQKDGIYKKIPQIGNTVLEDNVEIGANTTIDCGTMGSTIIRKGAKIDNLVQIAHNCDIGENTVMAGQTGLAGTTKVGKNCQFGGQVGLGGHLTVGNNVSLGAQSGLIRDVEDGEVLFGSPAIPVKDALRSMSVYKKLPTLQRDVARLQKEIKEIKNK